MENKNKKYFEGGDIEGYDTYIVELKKGSQTRRVGVVAHNEKEAVAKAKKMISGKGFTIGNVRRFAEGGGVSLPDWVNTENMPQSVIKALLKREKISYGLFNKSFYETSPEENDKVLDTMKNEDFNLLDKYFRGELEDEQYAKGSTVEGGGIGLEDKVKIVANLEDHEGYKKGQVVEVIAIDDEGYLTVEGSDGTQWYVGEEEVKLFKQGSRKFKNGGKAVSVGSVLKGGFKFHNLSSGDKVIYGKKELRVSSVGQDHLFALDKFGKQYKITSINDIKPSEELSKKLGILANGGGVGGTFDSSNTGETLGGTFGSSQSGEMIGGTMASSMYKKGGGVESVWGGIRGGLKQPMLSFSKNDYDVNVDTKNMEVDVNIKQADTVNQIALNDTDAEWTQHHWGYMVYPKTVEQLYNVLKALKTKVSKERLERYFKGERYAEGGLLEQRIELAKKKSKEHKKGNHFGSEVYLVLKHKTDPEEIFVISQWNYNIDKNRGYWKDYDIVFKTNEMSKGGQVGAFWDGLSVESRANWLKKRKDIPSDYKSSLKRDTFEKLPDWIKEKVKKAYNEDKIYRAEGGGVGDEVYIEFLNKDKGFKKDVKHFKSYEQAVKWARKNFEKFNPDMIKHKFEKGGSCGCGSKFEKGGNTNCGCWHYEIGGL